MANVTIPAVGTGSTTPIVSTDNVSADSSQVQNVQWVTVSGGVLARVTPLQNGGTVVVTSSALPTGASTETTLAAVNTKLGASLPLPTGAATQTTLASVLSALGTPLQAGGTVVTGGLTDTQLRATAVPVSNTSLPLPTGAATQTTLASILAKQPALGTAGSPSADFITVQGNASGTPIPVSGTFSASGTNDLTASGTLSSTGTVGITNLNGMSICDVDVSGTHSGTLLMQATIDGTNWFNIATPFTPDTSGTALPNRTGGSIANGRYQVTVAGYSGVRCNCTVYASGSFVVALRASAGSGVLRDLTTVGGTAVDVGSGNLSAGTQRMVLATDQPNLTTPLNVNQSQVAGTVVDTNSGVKSAGTQRFVLATDQPALTNALKVDGSAVTQPVSGTVTANIGTAGTLALDATLTGGTQKTKIVDTGGTNVAVVKAASTAAAATDPALVVAISPNNAVALAAGAATIGALTANQTVNNAQINGVAPLMGNGVSGTGAQRVTIASDSTGQVVLAAGTATVGNVGVIATTTGGASTASASITNTVTSAKASAGVLYGYHLFNANATTIYVQIFDLATGSVTLGTTAPKLSLGIPAGGGATLAFDSGIQFSTAISFACTTTRAGSTAPASSVDVNLVYA